MLAFPMPDEVAAFAHLPRSSRPFAEHAHSHYQLLVPVHGVMTFEHSGERLIVAPPQALLAWPDVAHSVRPLKADLELFTLQLTAEAIFRRRRS
jgi:hypothetical protein